MFKDAADVQYRRAAPTLHRAWWRYRLHSMAVEDAHLGLLRLVSAPAYRMLHGALTQRDTVRAAWRRSSSLSVLRSKLIFLWRFCMGAAAARQPVSA